MNIRAKLTLQFSIIVASLLVLFSASVYYFSSQYRKEEFFSRLKDRALTTARLFVTVKEIDEDLLRIIDRNTINALVQEKILVYNEKNELVYASIDDHKINHIEELLPQIRRKKYIQLTDSQNEVIGLTYTEDTREYIILCSAYDRFGRSKLKNLRNVLVIGLVVGIVIIILAGRLFAGQSLLPIARLNEEISNITAQNLNTRVNEGNRTDEIAQLAINFNLMLERLEAAFEMQQNFVSNASHELRTPLAAIISQLQVGISKERSAAEYKTILQSVSEDSIALSNLTNGLLELAQSAIESQKVKFQPTRIDEILFHAQEELQKQNPDYQFSVKFEVLPDDENSLTVFGSAHLLKTVFINLMDNACKFSADHRVEINISFRQKWAFISFQDKGRGISRVDMEKIFQPFYRGQNILAVKGHGIGLSLSNRIVQLHNGTIEVTSEYDKGSCFTVKLPTLQSA